MTREAVRIAVVGGLLALASAAGCSRGPETYRPTVRPPATRVDAVSETMHGVTVTDEYRWLEGASGADGSAVSPDVAVWTDAQRQYTRSVLDPIPGRSAVQARLAALADAGDLSLPLMSGNRYFFWQRLPGESLPTVFVRDGALGSDRALLRPVDLDPDGRTVTHWMMPSPDGKLLAFGAARPGETDSALRLVDVGAGRLLPLEIRGSPRAVHWLPDSTGFIYHRLTNPADPSSNVVLFHQLGRDPKTDLLLHRQYTPAENAQLAATAGPIASLSSDGRWLVAGYWTSADSNDLWLVNFEELRRTGGTAPRLATVGTPGSAAGTVVGDTLFIHTTKSAPNGRVVAVEVDNPAQARWRNIVPERSDAVIERVAFGRGLIVVTYVKHASNVTEVFTQSGRSLGVLAQPGIGTTSIATGEDRTEAFLLFQSFNHPPTVFRADLLSPTSRGAQWKASPAQVDPESVGVEQVRYRSKDGTEVSMFLVRRKDRTPNGARPTVLMGYGAFGVPMTPEFTAHWFQWFDAGGTLAVAHVRGGGEYGPAWHAAGVRDGKMKSFEDFIAAAEWLIVNGHTNAETLALYGGTAGGLLAGGALVERPDLFRAAILVSPLLDMLRYDRFLQARAWTPEFGAPSEPDAFTWLRGYSPYHRVTRGTTYPAVLLAASEAASAVHAMHARKMAARLQAATGSDPRERPVLLWVEKADSAASQTSDAMQTLVDQRVFLMWQLGVK
jgi:prolyl oligopeptidase